MNTNTKFNLNPLVLDTTSLCVHCSHSHKRHRSDVTLSRITYTASNATVDQNKQNQNSYMTLRLAGHPLLSAEQRHYRARTARKKVSRPQEVSSRQLLPCAWRPNIWNGSQPVHREAVRLDLDVPLNSRSSNLCQVNGRAFLSIVGTIPFNRPRPLSKNNLLLIFFSKRSKCSGVSTSQQNRDLPDCLLPTRGNRVPSGLRLS